LDPGPPKPAIASRILGEILLVILLAIVEIRGLEDFGGDPAEAGPAQCGLVGVA
jgi:hypothetical protein